MLDAWCASTGPPVVALAPHPSAVVADGLLPLDELAVVSWNVHVGGADLPRLVADLRSGALTGGRPVMRFVLLLQEAYRTGAAVPTVMPEGVRAPRSIRPARPGRLRVDIVEHARQLGLSLVYAPSMRNGPPAQTSEDRGNAILSTEPLTDVAAIELPFERQRRVAVVASIAVGGSIGDPWTLRLASVHLESTASMRRLRVLAQEPRRRQVLGLLAVMPANAPMVVGGDFNTWFGYADRTYKAMVAAVPDASAADRRPTYARFLRLDHVFSRLPDGWTAMAARQAERFGSDHFPIIARVRGPAAAPVGSPR